MTVLPMYINVHEWCPRWSEGFGTGVMDGCEPGVGNLQEQKVLLTPEHLSGAPIRKLIK